MEATMFTGWIYDHLKPHAAVLRLAHPLMLRAIALVKKKNHRIDASKICNCLCCDFLPQCYMASHHGPSRTALIPFFVQTCFDCQRPVSPASSDGRCNTIW